jgi:hypothetical protein
MRQALDYCEVEYSGHFQTRLRCPLSHTFVCFHFEALPTMCPHCQRIWQSQSTSKRQALIDAYQRWQPSPLAAN